MADSVDNIRIRAELEGALARDAHIAGDEVERLGDKALEAAAKLEVLDKANKDAGASSTTLGQKAEVVGDKAEDAAEQVDKLGDASAKAAKSHRAQHKGLDALNRALGLTQRIGRRLNPFSWFSKDADKNSKAGGRFNKVLTKMLRLLPRLAMFGLIASGLSFLATALNGVGAAGIAAVAGLAPLTGMLVAYPGMLAAIMQGMAAFKLGTAGMGELIKATLDPEATAEALKKARKNMAQSQLDFAQAVKSRKSAFMDMRKTVGGNLFDGLDDTLRSMADSYLPILTKHLGDSATEMNGLAKGGARWLQSTAGIRTMNDVMGTNTKLIGSMGAGLGNVLKTVLFLVRAGGPMLERMGKDFEGWTADLAGKTRKNQKPLEAFFDRSYDLFKRSGKVLGTYMRGLYNIGKESDVLGKYLGGSIESIGKRFEAWTSSKGGKRDIRKYFREMVPVVRELGLWLRDIGKFLAGGAMDPDQFVKTSKSLRENLLPAAAKAIQFANATLVPALLVILDVLGNLNEAGVIGGATMVLKPLGSAIVWISEKLAAMPDPVKKAVALATAIGTLYGAFKLIKGRATGGLLGKLFGGSVGRKVTVTNRVLRVFVTNKGIFGGPGKGKTKPTPVGGAPGRDPGQKGGADGKKPTRTARAAERVKRSPVGRAASRVKQSPVGRGASKLANSRAAKGAGRLAGPIGLALTGRQVYKDAKGAFATPNKEQLQSVAKITDLQKRYNTIQAQMKKSGVAGDLKELGVNQDKLAMSLAKSGTKGAYYNKVMEKAEKNVGGMGNAAKNYVGWFNKTGEWTNVANEIGKVGKQIGATSGQAVKYSGALKSLPKGVATKITAPGYKPSVAGIVDLTRKYNLTPKQVRTLIKQVGGKPTADAIRAVIRRASQLPKTLRTAISAPGFKGTYGNISRLAEKYRLTPRQVRTLVKESGANLTKGQMQRVIDKAKETGRQRPNIPVKADTSQATGALSSLLGKINSAYATVKVGISKVGSAIGGIFSYAGNPVPHAGFKSYVGELAPEAFMDRSGKMEMIGKHGPELRTFNRPGAIIPHTALADPLGGATGNTPKWAVDELRRKTLSAQAPQPATARPPTARSSSGEGSGGGSLSVSVAVDARGSNLTEAQIEKAAEKGTQKALREAKRRGIDHGWDRDL